MYRINHVGTDFLHKKGFCINMPAGYETYTLLLFKKEVTLQMDGKTMQSGKNSMVLLDKFVPRCYYNEAEDYTHDFLFFDSDDFPELVKETGLPMNRPVTLQNTLPVTQLLRSIKFEVVLQEPFSEQIIDGYIRALMYKIADILRGGNKYRHPDYTRFLELKNEIYRKPAYAWSVEEMSEKLYMSKSRFQHLYKEFFGTTPLRDLIDCRIQEACRLLQMGGLRVSCIAAACGYENEEHFIRQFKQVTGDTPGGYQKKLGR